jgi:hypothetical protein
MLRKLFYSSREVAELMSLKIETLRNWRTQGRGPTYSKIDKLVRYPVRNMKYLDVRRIRTKHFKS